MTRIINISYKTFFPEPNELIEQLLGNSINYKYEYIPVVIYNEKIQGKSELKINSKIFEEESIRSYSLYEAGTSFAQLRNYFKDDFNKNDLTLAKKAFLKLRNLAIPCAERIIADYCSQIILNSLKDNSQDSDEVIFFIEKLSTDKMLGRLGYLYLNLEKVTVCFLSIDPDDLMTTLMSKSTGKLHFDLFTLISNNLPNQKFGPYPGCSEDALEQTYFYSTSFDPNLRPSALRFDIFSQGLSENTIEEKSERIIDILNKEIIPHEITDSYFVNLPLGFKIAKDSWQYEIFKKQSIKNLISKNENKYRK
ncbi:MAG: hypothetical protein ACYDA4_08550 [Ignavibacteriaceae bacterium]